MSLIIISHIVADRGNILGACHWSHQRRINSPWLKSNQGIQKDKTPMVKRSRVGAIWMET